jgi:YfiH family protein
MTADCLPVLLCDRRGTRVAALHAGWRGLAAGILERGVAAMGCGAAEILVWIGPGIGGDAFEVGAEVRARFVDEDPDTAVAFRHSPSGRHLADLVTLARHRLDRLGVTEVHGGGYCTLSDPTRFFSYRRDGVTGRMASLIWLDADQPGNGETSHA